VPGIESLPVKNALYINLEKFKVLKKSIFRIIIRILQNKSTPLLEIFFLFNYFDSQELYF